MALDFEVESLDGVDEAHKPLYVEKDGKFRLDVTGIDPGDELKKALAAERKQGEASRKQLAEKQRLLEEAEQKKLAENNQFKELWEREKGEKEALKKGLSDTKRKSFVELQVAGLAKTPERAKLLQREMLEHVEATEDGVKIVGLPGVDTAEQLVAHFRDKYPFLIDESQLVGGGATGGARNPGKIDNTKLSAIERLEAAYSK